MPAGLILGGLFAAMIGAVASLFITATPHNVDVSFMPDGDPEQRMYFWWCRRCDGVGYVEADVVNSGGFNHTPKCPVRGNV